MSGGGQVELNVVALKLRAWLHLRDLDVVVVKTFDMVTRRVRLLLNGEEQTIQLTPEQVEELKARK